MSIDHSEVIRWARGLVANAGIEDKDLTQANFLDFAELAKEVLLEGPKARLEDPKIKIYIEGLRELRDNFASLVEADPPMVYRSQHSVADEFHRSTALIRYYRAPNRTAKTQSSLQEDYWAVTGSHPYLPKPPFPAQVAIVVPSFAGQGVAAFNQKLIEGESGNILSPMFPDGGKWLKKWDEKKHAIYLACRLCAEARRAGSCRHPGSVIFMFSSDEASGPINKGKTLSIAGSQYAIVHFSEQIHKRYFAESLNRIGTVPNSGMIVEETPIGGKGFWTHTELTETAKKKKRVEGTDRLYVSLHTISAYDAGLESKEHIDAKRAMMTEEEARARIFGEPAAYSETGVFNKVQISLMIKEIEDNNTPKARSCELYIRYVHGLPDSIAERDRFAERMDHENEEELLFNSSTDTVVQPIFQEDGNLRIYEMPEKFGQYVIGADVAQGLIDGDYSCAQVLKVTRVGLEFKLRQVAVYHGHINSHDFANKLFKLSIFYNFAALAPERRGVGDGTIQQLKSIGCWTLIRDLTSQSQADFNLDAQFGIDTNQRTKPFLVSGLQHAIWSKSTKVRVLHINDLDTIDELGAFGQEKTTEGTVKFRGESGQHDDRVIALAIAVHLAKDFELYDYDKEAQERAAKKPNDGQPSSGQLTTVDEHGNHIVERINPWNR
jgi:hypothetical protein